MSVLGDTDKINFEFQIVMVKTLSVRFQLRGIEGDYVRFLHNNFLIDEGEAFCPPDSFFNDILNVIYGFVLRIWLHCFFRWLTDMIAPWMQGSVNIGDDVNVNWDLGELFGVGGGPNHEWWRG